MADPLFRLSVATTAVRGLPANAKLAWAEPATHSPLQAPPAVRVGDFDLDGFPDLLAGLSDEEGSPTVALLRNRHGQGFEAARWRTTAGGSCARHAAPCAPLPHSQGCQLAPSLHRLPATPHPHPTPDLPHPLRSYVMSEDGADGGQPAIPTRPASGSGTRAGAHAAAFFDVDERGNLDVLLLSGTPAAPGARLLRNAFSSDAFFLKVITLDGQCLRWCDGPPDPSPPPYGVNQPAVSYAFSSKSATGGRRVYTGAQLSVSAHTPLLTPYTVFGLGRTNDYVSDFWVGLPSPHKRRFDAGIIPNSQLIAIPTPPDRPGRWTIELYISKAEMLPWVALALSAGLTLIGLVRARGAAAARTRVRLSARCASAS